MDIKLIINLYPSVRVMILDNIIQSLSKQGIFKLLIINGHGGNDFRQLSRELGRK